MPTIFMYPNLLLSGVEVNSKNELSGWVINGQWYYKEVQSTAYALHSSNYTEFLEELRSYLGIQRYQPINVKNLSLVGVSSSF